ncbi:MAG: SDR family oxidoreductase [Dysgonamonadaceae bacterium]|jgi:NAD(P)-dependent dehydrogenase (short-subunit alcohol dehydrogenase family)|nr:SDR family oxidoreductase [Dysgonamonadaceae bacterium]
MKQESYILVTGASSGFGREIAIRLSANSPVIIHGRDKERLKETLSACNPAGKHLIWEFDLSDVNGVEESLTRFLSENNCVVGGFVHSAGYMKQLPLKVLTVDAFRQSFDVNVISAGMIMKVLMKRKVNQGALKSVVFISSNVSKFGVKAFSAYAASKSAVDGLMHCLAVELAPVVRVNSVLPGGIRTAMTEQIYQNEEIQKKADATYPLGPGTPSDIAGAVKFLLSDDARWITGQQLVVDGGRTINITI